MEIAEIKDLLNKMNAFAEDGDSLDSAALMQDPIVLNRLAVELLQQIDRDVKPELVIAPEGIESYFGYSLIIMLSPSCGNLCQISSVINISKRRPCQ